ncbi:transcription-repair coupling factor [Methylobacterium aerolatum]|uniref:Transcription-repair-coupling factor n=1 Tax=Methylobacterium aerolatum TaxID=418708 RepID=A0ABU0I675_9HYPH|nr:transcription-repair coupling factor [Methylobacterium aerolatum]MDQ0449380.1 transcription-repair coupling factor (superfamily II helicase) [Methylobacterium aerolatum]GJD36671.1 Transcription-repair-coupling factor [Methylobacterium aerolatum]
MAKPHPKPQAPAVNTPAGKPQAARFALPKSSALAKAMEALKRGDSPTLAGVPEGFDAVVAADLARALAPDSKGPAVLVHVARDSGRSASFQAALGFAAPELDVMTLPAWDCQPYDRVSPTTGVAAQRVTALARLARTRSSEERPRILCTTINALVQRVPPKAHIARETFSAAVGNAVAMDGIVAWVEANGFLRTGTVRDTGEYAVRGGILDLSPPGLPAPIRLDFFGDTLESIRAFDPETQRTTGQLRSLDLVPMSEVQLTTETIRRFRQNYIQSFGAATRDDRLYETVSEGRRYAGLEHWMPLFYDGLDTLFDYLAGVPLLLDPQVEEAASERIALVQDYYQARETALKQPQAGVAPYKPLPPRALYLTPNEVKERLATATVARMTPFDQPDSPERAVIDCGAKPGRSFAPERADEAASVFDAAVAHIRDLQGSGHHVILGSWSDGSRDRLCGVLSDHGLKKPVAITRLADVYALKRGTDVAVAVWGLEAGFTVGELAVVSEGDILGDRLVRQKRKAKRPQDVILEVQALQTGDLVVHADHGIGRFIGLKTIHAAGAPHDCLELQYTGGQLLLPVENIELLTRYGSEDSEVALDRLGGGAWQARKAKMKRRILEMAGELIKIAAQRFVKKAPLLKPPEGLYEEFAARFPFEETEDQANAIDAVLDDLNAGRPMDRLVCGDVGFGKTEVALRAAFAGAIAGKQVAVIVPTTLLARQHYRTFAERFKGLPIQVAQLSRFVSAGDMKQTRAGLAAGTVDIVVGTHALLAKNIAFKDLGLLIVDEEQHFGVSHKERLKALQADVHVLTLSATPIPRTLQLAMTGVRELSIIATPPVDRLVVRTFITPFDPLSIREALLRERYRGGQSFYVVPRIEDLAEVKKFLDAEMPEIKVAVAHGQMAAGQLEDVMTAFYEGKFDVLLSTTIVESGLDIPTANTLIVHRADMFGLAQLYQLRGRVGRSKARAYALFTTPAGRQLTPQAEQRLKVLQGLDTLGAGFQLASHDLDIRGAGNLLGDAQSGHIKEVGYELYQQMLEDAVTALKAGIEDVPEEAWSPTIALGAPVTIPETYVEDLSVRLGLYRRLATIQDDAEMDVFGAEMIDRFGPLPPEVEQLLKIGTIKILCLKANVEKVEAGPKGVVVHFRDRSYANPTGLVAYVAEQASFAKVRPDMSVVFVRELPSVQARLKTATEVLRSLVKIAQRAGKKAA